MQYFYSPTYQDIEDAHVPVSTESGLGILPWSPLSFSLLTGKYDCTTVEAASPRASGLPRDAAATGELRTEGDEQLDGAYPFGDSLFIERNWRIVETLKQVAKDAGKTPAQKSHWLGLRNDRA